MVPVEHTRERQRSHRGTRNLHWSSGCFLGSRREQHDKVIDHTNGNIEEGLTWRSLGESIEGRVEETQSWLLRIEKSIVDERDHA